MSVMHVYVTPMDSGKSEHFCQFQNVSHLTVLYHVSQNILDKLCLIAPRARTCCWKQCRRWLTSETRLLSSAGYCVISFGFCCKMTEKSVAVPNPGVTDGERTTGSHRLKN